MLASINASNGREPAEIREVGEPSPTRNEALVEVRAFSINRGELTLLSPAAPRAGDRGRTWPVWWLAPPRTAEALLKAPARPR